MMNTPRSFALTAALAVGCLVAPCSPFSLSCHAQVIDSLMDRDPDLPPPKVVRVFPNGAKALWRKALASQEADLRCKAADAFARARRRGVARLDEAVPDLVEILRKEDEHPAVRVAVARALVDLDARSAAGSLWEQAQKGGIDLREVVEPALARWKHVAARDAWLKRVADPDTPQRQMVLAMRGLAAAREAKAVDALRERMTSDRTTAPLRLEAARALGQVRAEGLEDDAAALAKDQTARGLAGRLMAVALLARHGSKEAVALLQTLAKDREPAVASAAVGRLIEIDPKLASGVRDQLLASRDPALRAHGVVVLLKVETDDSVGLLGKRLDDPHPDVRGQARRALFERATKRGQRKAVLDAATAALATKEWRAQEQAALLLADLDHRPACARLAELLSAQRPEVYLTAAWVLRRLGDVDSLPAVLAYASAEQKRFAAGKTLPGRAANTLNLTDMQLSQLAQLMGRAKYAEADALLRRLVPRNDSVQQFEARAAAIWALGLLHQDKPPAALAKQLEERLNDNLPLNPEAPRVRLMAAVSLGRMKVKAALPSLRKHGEGSLDDVSRGCLWAIERLTGEKAPAAVTREAPIRDWFAVPND
jgi:HEAT repeat protein